jgi:hypothetical protein
LYICVINIDTMTLQDNKTETIITRVPAELKKQLQKMADLDNRKLSDFIRLQLMNIAQTSKIKK